MRAQRLATRLIAGAALFTLGCGGLEKLDWTDWGRESWQRPDDLVEALALEPGDRVADIGAGHGYFLARLAHAVGPEGRVYAVDVDADLVRQLEVDVADESVEVILGTFEDPLLPDGAIDLVLLVNTYHHIDDRPAYFARLRGDLSSRGRVAVVEPNEELGGILSLFVEEGHASTAAGVTEEMRAAGFRASASHDFLPVQIFEVFEPGSNDD